ncbi:MAG: glycosyltransferase family 1 protein [Rhodospirillaceae bacterium]
MRILVVSDAWTPQVNGVVRTLVMLKAQLEARGHQVMMLTPDGFRTVPCPTYPEIRLAVLPGRRIAEAMESFRPEAVHIATEAPLGWAARRYCVRRGVPFTTAFHTKFPEYVQARFGVPVAWSYAVMRRFHAPSQAVMVATQSIEDQLTTWGLSNIRRWTRGVDTTLFRPRPMTRFADLPRPVFLYVGRVAVEKNIDAFLALDLPGSKVVVGDGPLAAELAEAHPEVTFCGARHGEDLAAHYASADVFIFPSLTDTFGLVVLEALASGLPVAAFPVAGPVDVIGGAAGPDGVGVLSDDLRAAALAALDIPRERCRAFAEQRSWAVSVDQFLANVSPFDAAERFSPA